MKRLIKEAIDARILEKFIQVCNQKLLNTEFSFKYDPFLYETEVEVFYKVSNFTAQAWHEDGIEMWLEVTIEPHSKMLVFINNSDSDEMFTKVTPSEYLNHLKGNLHSGDFKTIRNEITDMVDAIAKYFHTYVRKKIEFKIV
jgi:hypothetical protein